MTDIVERLRATPNWKREECRHWKDVTCVYDRSPFEAADEIEQLRAELAACRDRLDWVAEKFFERKWDGTINRPCNWYLRGDYRHTAHKMKGDTFDAAIDSARKGEA